MNTSLADFVRLHMGLRINEIKNRPVMMYNNYIPFNDRLNDTLIVNLAKIASECGIKQFEIDCGWHTTQANIGKSVSWISNTGDWMVDKTKFPDGLKPVFDEIRKEGMEPGLWISVGSAAGKSKVFQDHPEWAVRNEKGESVDLHTNGGVDLNTMCFGTEWTGYIKKKICHLCFRVKKFESVFQKRLETSTWKKMGTGDGVAVLDVRADRQVAGRRGGIAHREGAVA